jgi:hypothetical protein
MRALLSTREREREREKRRKRGWELQFVIEPVACYGRSSISKLLLH